MTSDVRWVQCAKRCGEAGRRSGRRPARTVPVLLALALTFVLPPGATAKEAKHLGALEVGKPLFWDGRYVKDERLKLQGTAYFTERVIRPEEDARTDPCVTDTSPCWLYSFEVAPGANELRVAIDSATRSDCFAFELIDPDGVSRGFPANCPMTRIPNAFTPERFNLEVRAEQPVAGEWSAKVVVVDATDWAFRMRAALIGESQEPELLTPNLVAWQPHEVGFVAPANPHPMSFRDNVNEIGARPVSCATEEMASEGARHCLRFSSGVHNVGHGPLHVKFNGEQGTQHTFYSDKTPAYYRDNHALETPAGNGEFHPEHEHRHLEGMLSYELFRVKDVSPADPYDPSGKELVLVGESPKRGFCTGPYGMGRWQSFEQDPNGTMPSQFHDGDCNASISLDKGWGDQYRYTVTGQYIEYSDIAEADGTMPPGSYVLRATVDPDNRVLETSESDNAAYALIRVIEGECPLHDRVVIDERGLGSSPWDPGKRVEEEPFWWKRLERSRTATPYGC